MKAYIQLTKAQLLIFLRNRNSLIWSLLLPVLMILALGTLMRDGGNQISLSMVVLDQDQSIESKMLTKSLQKTPGITWKEMNDEKGALEAVRKGELSLYLRVEKGFGAEIQLAKQNKETKQLVTLFLDQSNPTVTQLAKGLVEQQVDLLNKQAVGYQPAIAIQMKNVKTNQVSYIDFFVPGVLSLLIMSNNLNGAAATISSWRERGILRRMQGTPLKPASFIGGQITARIIINTVQAITVLLMAYLIFDVQVYGSWALLFFIILLGTLTFLSIGMIVASLARTPESASPIAGLISFPMIFVGGIFFPVKNLPDLIQPIVQAIPIGHLTDSLRGVMNDGATFMDLWIPITVLLAWTIGSFITASLTFRWDTK